MKNEDLNRKQKRRKRDPNVREGQYLVGRRDAPNLIPSVDLTSTEHRRLKSKSAESVHLSPLPNF